MNFFDMLVDLFLDQIELDAQDGMSASREVFIIGDYIRRVSRYVGPVVKELARLEAEDIWNGYDRVTGQIPTF